MILNFQSKNSPNLLIKERMAAVSLRKHQWDKRPLLKNAVVLEDRSTLWITGQMDNILCLSPSRGTGRSTTFDKRGPSQRFSFSQVIRIGVDTVASLLTTSGALIEYWSASSNW